MRARHAHLAELPWAERRKCTLHPRHRDVTSRESGRAGSGEDEVHTAVVRKPDWKGRARGVVDGRDVREVRLQREAVFRASLQDERVRCASESEGDVAGIVAGIAGAYIPFDVDGRGLAGGEDGWEGPRFHVVWFVGHASMPVIRRAVDQVDFAANTHS